MRAVSSGTGWIGSGLSDMAGLRRRGETLPTYTPTYTPTASPATSPTVSGGFWDGLNGIDHIRGFGRCSAPARGQGAFQDDPAQ